MQDRLVEADRLGEFRVGMKRVAVARKPVEQRLVGLGFRFHRLVRRPVGDLVGRRRALARTAEPAIAAREDGGFQRAELVLALFRNHRLGDDDRALAFALVPGADDAAVGGDLRGHGQRAMQRQLLFAMHHHHVVDAAIGHRSGAPGDDGRHGRHGLQVLFVNEGEFLVVHRVAPEADAQRVKHGFAVAIAEFLPGRLQRHEVIVIDRHFRLLPVFSGP